MPNYIAVVKVEGIGGGSDPTPFTDIVVRRVSVGDPHVALAALEKTLRAENPLAQITVTDFGVRILEDRLPKVVPGSTYNPK